MARLDDMEEIGDGFESKFRKEKVTINKPFQVGIVVYQLAKLRILQFYYDYFDCFIDRRDFELMQMDTDSMYLRLSFKTLEEAVRPELLEDFEATKKIGSHKTNEAIARRVFSSWSSKEPVGSPSAVNVITWTTKRRAQPSCHRRTCPSGRTSSHRTHIRQH